MVSWYITTSSEAMNPWGIPLRHKPLGYMSPSTPGKGCLGCCDDGGWYNADVGIPAPIIDLLFEHATLWGIRKVLTVMKRPFLEKLRSRVSAHVLEDRWFLAAGVPNRYVTFPIEVKNPTPWELQITDIACSISYNDLVVTHRALIADTLPIKIEKETETTRGKVIQVRYDPVGSVLGLPIDQNGWRIEGRIRLSSNFGEFDVPIPLAILPKGQQVPEQVWNKAVDYIKMVTGKN